MQTLHVGDRFTASGNDNATRDCCAILWVACPEETVRPDHCARFLGMLEYPLAEDPWLEKLLLCSACPDVILHAVIAATCSSLLQGFFIDMLIEDIAALSQHAYIE